MWESIHYSQVEVYALQEDGIEYISVIWESMHFIKMGF